jgi:hypothetical protein
MLTDAGVLEMPPSSLASAVSGRIEANQEVARFWGSFRVTGDPTSAGINRHVVGDARALRERRQRLHPDL